ncbi:hypothetical protein CC78DRAFT_615687 [Lojkania enalia]|uniref:T6SS Phospholipase effector Tle1-like catalytic domain-containing protein n=1 Tax=Lojkania enalia TaxID=147567 RepID=A0A9P4KBW3_9PLEO|nr:hypothetical protein CC78DRAFT_615687 [Didymosphaeria enalia]
MACPQNSAPIKLIVCCDGTACSEYIATQPLTNVSRISRSIAQNDDNGNRQLVYYLPGIGSDDANLWPSNKWNQAVGKGLDRMLLQAYGFICHNYNKEREDQIILIGFSRGAFAVRCLADLILEVGVLKKNGLYYVHELYDLWRNQKTEDSRWTVVESHLYTNVRIKACAVWDTVSSIGVPWPSMFGRQRPGGPSFVHSDLCERIENAFQALSLDEHRYHFHPLVWRFPDAPLAGGHLEQCWFLGYHADVGGGNPKEALAHIALAWVITKLKRFVTFDGRSFCDPSPTKLSWVVSPASGRRINRHLLPVEDPMDMCYRLAGSSRRTPRAEFWNKEGLYRRDNDGQQDDIASGERMHSTVRSLIKIKIMKNSSFDGIDPEFVDDAWRWRLPHRTETWLEWIRRFGRSRIAAVATENEILEDPLDRLETELLMAWVNFELDTLQNLDGRLQPRAGDPSPNTILIQFKAWLRRPMDNPLPLIIPQTRPWWMWW